MLLSTSKIISVFDILNKSTIVFAHEDTGTVITIDGTGLNWWIHYNEAYWLSDELFAFNKLDVISIEEARKMAKEWFDTEILSWADNVAEGLEQKEQPNDSATSTMASNDTTTITTTTTIYNSYREVPLPLVKPKMLGESKKDIHTEHCCRVHSYCKYNESKCPVVSGKKKQSYLCRCKESVAE